MNNNVIKFKGESGNIEVKLIDITFAERKKFNDILYGNNFANLNFSDYCDLVQIATNMDDESMNALSDRDITSLADKCYVLINRKKK